MARARFVGKIRDADRGFRRGVGSGWRLAGESACPTLCCRASPGQARRPVLQGGVDGWVEAEDFVQQAHAERLEDVAGSARHPHLAADSHDLVEARYEAADAGAVNRADSRQVEDEQALSLADQILHQSDDLIAFGAKYPIR